MGGALEDRMVFAYLRAFCKCMSISVCCVFSRIYGGSRMEVLEQKVPPASLCFNTTSSLSVFLLRIC